MNRCVMGVSVAVLLGLSGCASLSESQCLANDWQTVGYRDGLQGKQSSHLLNHHDACLKHGVVPNRDTYMLGWHKGVSQYCLPENGFAAGERGASYGNVCPEHLQASFFDAYQQGRKLYLAKAEISDLQKALHHKERHLERVKHDLVDAEALLIEGDLTSVERRELLDETKELAKQQGELEAEIEDLKIETAVKEDRLASLRHTLAFQPY